MDAFKTRKKKEKKSEDNLLALLTATDDNSADLQDPTKTNTAITDAIEATAKPAAADTAEDSTMTLNNVVDTDAVRSAVAQKRKAKGTDAESTGPADIDNNTGFKASLIQVKQQEAKAKYIAQQMVQAGVWDESAAAAASGGAVEPTTNQPDVRQRDVLLKLAAAIPVRKGQREAGDDEEAGVAFSEVKLTISEREEILTKTRDYRDKMLTTRGTAELEKLAGCTDGDRGYGGGGAYGGKGNNNNNNNDRNRNNNTNNNNNGNDRNKPYDYAGRERNRNYEQR